MGPDREASKAGDLVGSRRFLRPLRRCLEVSIFEIYDGKKEQLAGWVELVFRRELPPFQLSETLGTIWQVRH